ncbi:hypothetical protein J1N35_025931 [Gossypium stocksii]|uniref:Uncharacterized protein n=1 Tax=Gossypium stocksii TaxID=47602 RepID=A0A9D3V9V7_9ROSI|nr:hypothetical protein J1N35_025931 [Gossypium stocksii]
MRRKDMVLRSGVRGMVLQMGKRDVSDKVMAMVLVEIERVVSAPKFKRPRLSAVWDFLPKCERVTTLDFRLNRQIAVDQSMQGSGDYDYLVLYVVRCVFLPYS